MPSRNPNLIFDIGTSEGNDTKFYLDKGFDVVSVEADPIVYAENVGRFQAEIDQGRLQTVNRAAHNSLGTKLEFWRNEGTQGHSSLAKKKKVVAPHTVFEVISIDYPSLIALKGVPHYCKIDIEGGETDFLKSVADLDAAPRYISAEVHTFAPIEQLHRIGYRLFKLVDQKIARASKVPNPALEGLYVEKPSFKHASGPFGRELVGTWLSYDEVTTFYAMIKTLKAHPTIMKSWFDCHAWNGETD